MAAGGDRIYESLVAQVYDAALVQGGWDELLERLCGAVGGQAGTMFFQDRASPQPDTALLAVIGYPSDAPTRYDAHFAAQDHRLAQALAAPAGRVMADGWGLDHESYLKSEIFNDFYRPAGLECALGVNLFTEGSRMAVFSTFRPVGRETFGSDELTLIGRLAPHLTRVLQLKRQLDRAAALAAGLLDGLDRFSQAVVLLDADGRISANNAAAEALFGWPGCPLMPRSGRLTAKRPEDDAALRRCLADAAKPGSAGPPPVMRFAARDGSGDVGMMAVPTRRADRIGIGAAQGTLVFLSARRPEHGMDPAVLAAQFGLSPAEAQVAAALADGSSVNELADRRRVSRETVRAQVRAILLKTGLRSQGRLVGLLSRSLGALRRP